MPKIYLYAEVLTHIKQLTLHASLQSDKEESPQIDISSDKKVITVVHDGESSSLYLPTQIVGTANVTFETEKKTEISARIQIEDLQEWKLPDAAGSEAPWAATDLTDDVAIFCMKCEASILPTRRISSWKELPSQDWADVMDLWYCHKPHEDHDTAEQKRAAETRGTSATSKLASTQGVGMVDVVSFVLNPNDCQSIQISVLDNENDVKPQSVTCSNCRALLGSFSSSENLVRLYKSNLKVKDEPDGEAMYYPPATFICAQLLSLIDSTPIRKVVVYSNTAQKQENRPPKPSVSNVPDDYSQLGLTEPIPRPTSVSQHSQTTPLSPTKDSTPGIESTQDTSSNPDISSTQTGLLLWIFNPDIYYSCSLHPSCISTPSNPTAKALRAMKVFYKPLLDPLSHINTTGQITVEELQLPTQSDVDSLHDTLKCSNNMLPQSARKFQDWDVGLLDRYEKNATANMVMEDNPLARKVVGEEGDGRVTRWELPEGYQELYL